MNENFFDSQTGDASESSSNSVTYGAATSITSPQSQSDKSYTSSTADENALLVSPASGTVTLTNLTVTNGNAQFPDAVILYQSQSGDAADGTASFVMSGGELVNKSGHLFHVIDTEAVISLSGVTINDTGNGVFIFVCDDGRSGASNVATVYASN